MNVVREINRINELELKIGSSNASWHDEYKDSAYVYVGGLNFDLTEGDVITIMSQYGEIMDINMPRDKETGKSKGFAFVMYEDQRSTVLAVDNLNGAKVLEKALRVDHVRNYKQPGSKNEDGEWVEAEEQSFNARPEMIEGDGDTESSESSGPEIDPEDPMYEYLVAKRKEEKALKKKKSKSKGKHKDKYANETPEERKARKAAKKARKAKKAKSEGVKGVEDLLASLGGPGRREREGSKDGDGERRDEKRERDRERERDKGYGDERYRDREGRGRQSSRSWSPRRYDRDDRDRRR